MIETREHSLINLAEYILEQSKEPIELYQLFDMVLERSKRDIPDEIGDMLNAFYADITSSAKFIYMGNNTWDLKKHQKIELWEKDGSYYNEYTEVHDDIMDERIALQNAAEEAHQAKLEKRKLDELTAQKDKETIVVEPIEAVEETIIEPIEAVEETIEVETVETVETIVKDEKSEAVEEVVETETEEEYEDFDEEEYNKYMDTYEDEYDK